MGSFILHRCASRVVLLLVAAIGSYLLASSALDPRANFEGRNPPPPSAVTERALDELNLNDKTPTAPRLFRWAGGVVQGDFGKSIGGDPIGPELARRVAVTLRLLLPGALLGGLFGVFVGVLSGLKQYGLIDRIATTGSFVILATPTFVIAVLLKMGALHVNRAAGTTWFYYAGESTPGLRGSWWDLGIDRVQHLVLPVLTIALVLAAFSSRFQRGAMLDVLHGDVVLGARSRGLPRRRALWKHGLRTALVPMVTYLPYQFGLLITGAAVVEKIFGWHGMGAWFIDSISNNDVNAVAAVALVSAAFVLFAGMLAELAHAALDPRLRFRRASPGCAR